MSGQGEGGSLDELKAAVLLGEISLEDPRVEELGSEARAELASMLALCSALDRSEPPAPEEPLPEPNLTDLGLPEEAIQELMAGEDPEAEAIARAFLADAPPHDFNPGLDRPRSNRARWGGVIAIAAGIALMLWGLGQFGDLAGEESVQHETGGGVGVLGQLDIESPMPAGEVNAWNGFSWQGLPSNWVSWRVRVCKPNEQGQAGEELALSELLFESRWDCDRELPDSILWRIEAVVEGGEKVESDWIAASLVR